MSEVKVWIVVAAALTAGTAQAGGLADAIARHAPADVEALRAQLPGDATIRCTLGAVYAKRTELSRAAVYLLDCDEAQLPAEISDTIAKLAKETTRKLRESDLAVLEIVTKPTGMTAEIGALPGEHLRTPATVWIPGGSYDVRATLDGKTIVNHVTAVAHTRAVIYLEDTAPVVQAPKPQKADFTDETEPADRQVAPPPAIKHGSLMSNKLRGVADPTTAGPQLDDPLALVEDPPPPIPPATRIGLRLGGGAASHTGGSRLGPSIAIAGHLWLAGDDQPFELELRADWSRRGGDDGAIDALGASAGLAKVFAAPDTAWVSGGLAIRGERRFGEAMVEAYGVAAAAQLELSLRRLPVVVGARFEQGLTALVDGNRERVVIVEVGFDLRAF